MSEFFTIFALPAYVHVKSTPPLDTARRNRRFSTDSGIATIGQEAPPMLKALTVCGAQRLCGMPPLEAIG